MLGNLKGDVSSIVQQARKLHPNSNLVLIHGCNCLNNMGAGLAQRIAELYPAAKVADSLTQSHDKGKLGDYTVGVVENDFVIVNLYSQYKYGGVYVNVDYDALSKGFDKVMSNINSESVVFLIPEFIGCGLAGGDINIVRPMIETKFADSKYYLFDR